MLIAGFIGIGTFSKGGGANKLGNAMWAALPIAGVGLRELQGLQEFAMQGIPTPPNIVPVTINGFTYFAFLHNPAK